MNFHFCAVFIQKNTIAIPLNGQINRNNVLFLSIIKRELTVSLKKGGSKNIPYKLKYFEQND